MNSGRGSPALSNRSSAVSQNDDGASSGAPDSSGFLQMALTMESLPTSKSELSELLFSKVRNNRYEEVIFFV